MRFEIVAKQKLITKALKYAAVTSLALTGRLDVRKKYCK